jgi:hypothetical protein
MVIMSSKIFFLTLLVDVLVLLDVLLPETHLHNAGLKTAIQLHPSRSMQNHMQKLYAKLVLIYVFGGYASGFVYMVLHRP